MSSATGSDQGGRTAKPGGRGGDKGQGRAGADSGPGSAPEAPAGAREDLDQAVDDLDQDLAVEHNLGVDPDELTGDGGLETDQSDRPVIRDNRKVDPISGRARKAGRADQADRAGGAAAGGRAASGDGPTDLTPDGAEAAARALEDEVVAAAELISAREELAVRTEDLQRLSADYANYRKRVDRDRAVAGDQARAEVATALIPVLDDIDAARAAGELEGPIKAVSEKLEAALAKFDIERYGLVGEPFDPTIHEALLHQTDPAATEPTISLVLQPGYRMGERVLRATRVGVVDSEG
ncbi:MAG: nucleotide exchange factor GrpE [Bifidobacteriaceae bacterium]|jgi:molecular chaperone GrpE|nr:nucleotide exchange factor GrpE [Bifidobacteriaceae bacterium]